MKIEQLKTKYLSILKQDSEFIHYLYESIFGFNEIKDFINDSQTASVLEIGCGSGILINELKLIYPNITFEGIEPFKGGHNKFKKYFNTINKVDVIHEKVEDLNINKKYDLIFSINVFEHVEDWEKYILKTSKLLNKSGKNVILCPNYDFPYESHYIIPIILNKKITKFIFNSIIKKKQKIKKLPPDHWESLNFVSKNQVNKFLIKMKFKYYFDKSINARIIIRLYKDRALISRHGYIVTIFKILKLFNIDKFIFIFLKVPFPYMKIVITK